MSNLFPQLNDIEEDTPKLPARRILKQRIGIDTQCFEMPV